MKVFVCVKHILDPELPPSLFEIDPKAKQAVMGKHPQVLDPYSANALEVALQLKDGNDQVHITAVSFGTEEAEDSLRKCLGLRADACLHVIKEGKREVDSVATAKVLAAAIGKSSPFDLVLCGRQAGDSDAGLVPFLLAEELGIEALGFVSHVEGLGEHLKLRRVLEGGVQYLETAMPVLVSVTNDESNLIRIAKIRDVMKAHKKSMGKVTLEELAISNQEVYTHHAFLSMEDLYIPVYDNVCQFIPGEEPEEKVDVLLERLREKKVL